MKFGKRLAAEAARRWTEQYLDYKLIKRALKLDIKSKGELGIPKIPFCPNTRFLPVGAIKKSTCPRVYHQKCSNPLPFRADATGQQFQAALLQELQKVSKFYLEKAEALEVCSCLTDNVVLGRLDRQSTFCCGAFSNRYFESNQRHHFL